MNAFISDLNIKSACSNCNLRTLCLPVGLSSEELEHIDQSFNQRRNLKRRSSLFQMGDAFSALYAIRSGFFKTSITHEDGREQVMGFYMAGDILGLEGISNEKHAVTATALEESQVCVISFSEVEKLVHQSSRLQRHLLKIMSREIVGDHNVMMLLGNMRAEERIAIFLRDLIQRLQFRGFSSTELILRMTREDIGSFLGMKLETVSRTFSLLQEQGMLQVQQRHVRILDPQALAQLANGDNCAHQG